MYFRRVLVNALAITVFALATVPWALAQQYQILRADYGSGPQRVDVTQRLRELARANATFRMGNSTFGIDPAPGHVKTLRIFTRGPDGRDRMFEYREGSVVDGARFTGWRGGNWGNPPPPPPPVSPVSLGGGQYVILRAFYGVPGRNVDVTNRLRDIAHSNAVFRMGNSTFGVDPAPGVVKTLRIWARGPRGDTRMFEYREGSTVDGARFTGWGSGNWGREAWRGGWNGQR
jgi:hypothetical protein